jgi:hypothetical protein
MMPKVSSAGSTVSGVARYSLVVMIDLRRFFGFRQYEDDT